MCICIYEHIMCIHIHLCINTHNCFMCICKVCKCVCLRTAYVCILKIYKYTCMYIYQIHMYCMNCCVHSAVSVYASGNKRIHMPCCLLYIRLLSLCHVFRQNNGQTKSNASCTLYHTIMYHKLKRSFNKS